MLWILQMILLAFWWNTSACTPARQRTVLKWNLSSEIHQGRVTSGSTKMGLETERRRHMNVLHKTFHGSRFKAQRFQNSKRSKAKFWIPYPDSFATTSPHLLSDCGFIKVRQSQQFQKVQPHMCCHFSEFKAAVFFYPLLFRFKFCIYFRAFNKSHLPKNKETNRFPQSVLFVFKGKKKKKKKILVRHA